MSLEHGPLKFWMDRQEAPLPHWSQPESYNLNDRGDRREMHQRIVSSAAKVERKVAQIADDLFEFENPDKKRDEAARKRFIEPIIAEGDRFGKWYYFSWSNRLVQFADQETHWQLLTYRDRELIKKEELPKIRHATTWHIGLSVGGSILDQTSHMGLGDKVVLADPDVMSVPNLNRIQAGMPTVGMRKTDVSGIKLSELNPYVRQIHFSEGLTSGNTHEFAKHQPDLIFEEVDHLPTKVLARKLAYRFGTALLMATDAGDRTMVDVERYDLGDNDHFLGRLTPKEVHSIEEEILSPELTVQLIVRLIGQENISDRLARSIGQIGMTLGGIAQLGTTASAGAAYAAVAGRDILLGQGPSTGRYKMSPQEILHMPYL